jgi:hypothetical protein
MKNNEKSKKEKKITIKMFYLFNLKIMQKNIEGKSLRKYNKKIVL